MLTLADIAELIADPSPTSAQQVLSALRKHKLANPGKPDPILDA